MFVIVEVDRCEETVEEVKGVYPDLPKALKLAKMRATGLARDWNWKGEDLSDDEPNVWRNEQDEEMSLTWFPTLHRWELAYHRVTDSHQAICDLTVIKLS
jgi:hypothetical protein